MIHKCNTVLLLNLLSFKEFDKIDIRYMTIECIFMIKMLPL